MFLSIPTPQLFCILPTCFHNRVSMTHCCLPASRLCPEYSVGAGCPKPGQRDSKRTTQWPVSFKSLLLFPQWEPALKHLIAKHLGATQNWFFLSPPPSITQKEHNSVTEQVTLDIVLLLPCKGKLHICVLQLPPATTCTSLENENLFHDSLQLQWLQIMGGTFSPSGINQMHPVCASRSYLWL